MYRNSLCFNVKTNTLFYSRENMYRLDNGVKAHRCPHRGRRVTGVSTMAVPR